MVCAPSIALFVTYADRSVFMTAEQYAEFSNLVSSNPALHQAALNWGRESANASASNDSLIEVSLPQMLPELKGVMADVWGSERQGLALLFKAIRRYTRAE